MVINKTTVEEYNKQALEIRREYLELLRKIDSNYAEYYKDVNKLNNLATNTIYLLTL